eukprot:CAMPEP_0178858092 /NCGR_PEP_ID=MMETSP0747-20121128/479_1 /TAXON_ID=913974 /ORGANISM="Nitzschia punctata, Strain CCMP561" /LENGTH=253 /DNA_ID=CAMNT_0020524363 /DNA_START=178 /DNA_END=939 /DNA_ORIENTATION=-
MESLPMVKKRIVALPQVHPASQLDPQNTIFILSFWILSQKIYSHQLTPQEARQLTQKGHCTLKVKESIFQIVRTSCQPNKKFSQKLRDIRQKNNHHNHGKLDPDAAHDDGTSGNAKHNETDNKNDDRDEDNDPLVVAKIHCIRLDTNQTCTLYHSNLPRFEMQRTHAKQDQVSFPVQRALSNTEAGDRLVAQWYHGWQPGIQNFGGLTFSITLKKNTIEIDSIVFGAPGQSDHLRERNGVSAFHILEEVSGWK